MARTIMLKYVAAIVLALGAGYLNAQNFYGLQNSNFAGINAIYVNPAGIADCRFIQHGNLFCFGTNASTNFGSFQPPFTLSELITGSSKVPRDSGGHIKWDQSWIKQNMDGKAKNVYMGIELRGPGFMTELSKKFSIAIATRTRSAYQLYNVSEDMAKFIVSQLDSHPQSLTQVKNNSFSMNLNAYQEFSFTSALVLLNKNAFYLKAGATAKYLLGIGSAYFINNGVDFTTKGKDTIVFNKSDVQLGYSNIDFLNRIKNGTFASSLPSFKQINGSGLGFDFGAIFEWRPKETDKITGANRYLIKGGVSLLDWGKISYGNKVRAYSANNNTPVVFTQDSAFSSAFAQGVDSGLLWMENYAKAHFNYKSGASSYKSSIPTTLNVQLDWNVLKWFYVGLNWTQSFVSKKNIAFRRPSSVVVIPRFETKFFELAFPISAYNDYSIYGLGAYLRIGPAFLGTDNLLRSIDKNSFNGFDFYFGISTGISTQKEKKRS